MSYFYDIRLLEGCHFFNSHDLKSSLHDSKDMIITSKPFKSFPDAEDSVSAALNNLADIEERGTGCNYVIVTRVNPNFSTSNKEKDSEWDDLTICKMYVADSVMLKSSKIAYSITAIIKCTHPDDIQRLR